MNLTQLKDKMQEEILIQLSCGVTHNDWGNRGEKSLVYRLSGIPARRDDIDRHFAELWMGDHPLLPSRVFGTEETLGEAIERLMYSYQRESDTRNAPLSFLFKVLSIGKTLSIQAHPNKDLAELLYSKDPETYTDENAKPEMIVAISTCEALVGFRPIVELAGIISHLIPIQRLLGAEVGDAIFQLATKFKTGSFEVEEHEIVLRRAFKVLLHKDRVVVRNSISQLLQTIHQFDDKELKGLPDEVLEAIQLTRRLSSEHPGDVGIILALFMNFIKLNPGESLFIPPGELHAYVSGDMVECMSSSANVIRAGLTSKFRDLDVLLSSLSFHPHPPRTISPRSERSHNHTSRDDGNGSVHYDAPEDLFGIHLIELHKGQSIEIDVIRSKSLLLCIGGEGLVVTKEKSESLEFGAVFYIGRGTSVAIKNNKDERLVCYRAHEGRSGRQ